MSTQSPGLDRRNFLRGSLAAAIGIPLTVTLASCSSGGGAASTKAGPSTVSFAFAGQNVTKEMDTAFEKATPSITLNAQGYPGDSYPAKVTTLVASGKPPDAMELYEADAIRLAKVGDIVSLDDYIKKSKVVHTNEFIPAVANLTQKMGGTYGLPWCYAVEMLFYNKDMFDAAGVTYPDDTWTWDDYRAAAKKLTGKNSKGKVWGTAGPSSDPGMWYSLAGQAGDEVIDGKGNFKVGDGMLRGVDLVYQMIHEDGSFPPPQAAGTTVTDLFLAGQAAMTTGGSWFLATYKDAGFRWDVAPEPYDTVKFATLHTGFLSITKAASNKDGAWEYIEWMMDKQGQSLLSKNLADPSCEIPLQNSTDWHVVGKSGQKDWNAVTQTATERGKFAYTLGAYAVSDSVTTAINSYLLGSISRDTLKTKIEESDKGQVV